MRERQNIFELLMTGSEGCLEEFRLSRHDAVGRLKNKLDRPKVVPVPFWPDMRSDRKVGRLKAHRERINANGKFLVEKYVEVHPLEEVLRRIMKIVKHVVR